MNISIRSVKYLLSSDSRGIAMIFVIVITGIVSLIIGIMMTQYITHTHSIKSSVQKIQSYYTAEAGIKKAFHYLKEDKEKGIVWRTGDLIQDVPIKEKVFYNRDDEVEISVIDDCGYLRIKSQIKGNPRKLIEMLAAGVVPDNLRNNLYLVSSKPLILNSGSQLNGLIKLNHEPIFHGGGIDGLLETNNSLSLPPFLKKTFTNSINYFRYLLSTPDLFTAELFAPQIFSPANPLPVRKFFVNDAVLIENRNYDSLWHAGNNLIIASTADVQISGYTKMNNALIIAIGSVKILDKSEVKSSKIYSETSIELREEAEFSGILIAPEIKIAEKARVFSPAIIYCGAPFKHGKMIFNNELPVYCNIVNLCSDKNSLIEISECAKIEGFIYSYAEITLRGEISGFVYSRGFREKPVTQDTTNTNIISGIIKPADSLNAFFIPVVFQDIKDFKIIQWQEF